MGRKISQELDFAISNAKISKAIKIDGNFLWPPNVIEVPLRIHKDDRYKRSIEEIPRQEILQALFKCVENSISILEEDLIKETARLFGLRATKSVSDKIRPLLNSLLSANVFSRKAGKIILTRML